MAALSDASLPGIVELAQLRPGDLDSVLEEEMRSWRRQLDWDFRPSADLVRRFVGMRALNGYAVLVGSVPVGYSYYVCEDKKGLIGDLYVMERFRSADVENRLLGATVDGLFAQPSIRRIESQLMMLRGCLDRPLPRQEFARLHPRKFMIIELPAAGAGGSRAPVGLRVEPWSDRWQEEAARLIAAAYRGHIDSEINDQYRSIPGARRFLQNIVHYPGCGSFFSPASCAALDFASGQLSGLCLGSMVAEDIGHITQICVSPLFQDRGIGRQLMRHALGHFAAHGCRRVSLTVTSANLEALRLYERMGFVTVREFAASVWEGF